MPNKIYANEWLEIARHHLESAEALLVVDHYTDIIGIELHQVIEKICKGLNAYNNQKIEKTHDLIRLIDEQSWLMTLEDDEMELIIIANDYYSDNRYPGPKYELPHKEEIKKVHVLAKELYKTVYNHINND